MIMEAKWFYTNENKYLFEFSLSFCAQSSHSMRLYFFLLINNYFNDIGSYYLSGCINY